MRAIVCTALQGPDHLELRELPDLRPGPREVRIRVAAAGVNFPDTLIIQGKYQHRAEPPFVPGAEVAGEVIEVGAQVQHVRPGDRVAAFIPVGGYASEALAPADACLPVPRTMPMAEAAGFGLAYGTVIHALKQCGRLQRGETLLVLGAAGGVGLAAVQLGRCMGARVIAAASSAEKLALAEAHGAEAGINYREVSLKESVRTLTQGRGADVIFDPVGGALTLECLSAAAWGGRHLVVGFADGEIPQIPANRLLLKEVSAVGVFWGAFVAREPAMNLENFRELFSWYEAGHFRPVISREYPLAEAGQALRDMMNRQVTGKVVLIP